MTLRVRSQRSPRHVATRRAAGVSLLSVLFCGGLWVGCEEDADPNWVQFNATEDQVEVQVGVDSLLDDVSVLLYSSSGQEAGVEVGTASVSPGGGPIGTEHLIVIEVYDDYQDTVGRATVRTDSADRGEDEYDLDPDSADEGIYTTTLVSVGDEGEQRIDTFTFRLWYDSEEEVEDTGS